jgi:glycosyltransferase involved in cell wall biosynthesis
MARILYANDLASPYDTFFLSRLSERHQMTVLSFLMRNDEVLTLPAGVGFIGYPTLRPLRRFPILGAPLVNALPHAILLRMTVRRLRPQVVIANQATSYGLYAALAGIENDYLFVWGSDVLVSPNDSPVLRLAVKFALRKARRILVDSMVQRDACVKLGAPSARILIIPWYDCRETAEAEIGPRERASAKTSLGLEQSDMVVVSTRWHRKPYSVETLIESVPLVVQEMPRTKFLVIGSGPDTPYFKDMASKLGVSKNVIFTGSLPRQDVLKYIQVADIYVSTSLSDGTSASLLDAMSLGIPAIVTDIPGNREWISPWNNGILFPPKDYEELAKQITILLGDGRLRKRLLDSARATVASRADWNKNSGVFDEVLDGIILKNSQW